jgi:hypothetical protein
VLRVCMCVYIQSDMGDRWEDQQSP